MYRRKSELMRKIKIIWISIFPEFTLNILSAAQHFIMYTGLTPDARSQFCLNSGIFVLFQQAQVQVILHVKMTMSDSQLYPLNLYLINNVEDIVVFFKV